MSPTKKKKEKRKMSKKRKPPGPRMTKLILTFPKGVWEDVKMPIFVHPDPKQRKYVFLSRYDIGKYLKPKEIEQRKFQQDFRSGGSLKGSMWNRFMTVESKLPYLLLETDKPPHQQEGWAGAHIYTLVTLSGFAAILYGVAGAENKLLSLFPGVSREYMKSVARCCIEKHNELTSQHIEIDDLAKLASQISPKKQQVKKRKVAQKSIPNERIAQKRSTGILHGKELSLKRRVADLYAEKKKLKQEVDSLREEVQTLEQLRENAEEGLIARIPLTLTNDWGDTREINLEIDINGIITRESKQPSSNEWVNPFDGEFDDFIF